MELKKQIQIISLMIILVLGFIFIVTSFSKEFYFQAYGNKEGTRAARTNDEELSTSESAHGGGPEYADLKGEAAEINEDELALGGKSRTSVVFINRDGRTQKEFNSNSISRSSDSVQRTDYIGPENDEGGAEELTNNENSPIPQEGVLPHIKLEDGTERNVIVLMFHDIVEANTVPNSTFLTKSTFENIMASIRDRGYETVDVRDLIDFVEGRKDLPLKSVILTFDDGYYSNYRLVYPILKRYKMKAIFFPIGISVGKNHYKDTELEMMRHYSIEDMQEMQASELVEFGSHSYDMHQNVGLEHILGNDRPRVTIVKLDTETEEEYVELFRKDIAQNQAVYQDTGLELLSFSCPRGGYDTLSLQLLKEAGFRSVFISKTGINTVVKGEPESLYLLKRYNISEDSDYHSLLP